MTIQALRQERAKKYESLQALLAGADASGRSLSEDEQGRFEALAAEIEALDQRIRVAERVQALRAEQAIPAPVALPTGADPNDPQPLPAQPRSQDQPGIRFAQMTRALIVGGGSRTSAARWAAATWGERHEVTAALTAPEPSAALQSNELQSGGALVPERWTMELIDLYRPMTVIRRNSREVPLVGGSDNLPVKTKGVGGHYIGEGQDILVDEPEFGAVRLVERQMAVLVPVSNKLLRNASMAVDVMVRDDIVEGFAQTEDIHFLRAPGTGPGPKGIRHWVPAEHLIPALGGTTPSIAQIDSGARSAELALLNNNVPMVNVRWIMAPRVFTYLRDLRDDNGNLVYASLSLPSPNWKGYPVEVTTQVPFTLGGTTDESEIYLVAFAQSVVADSYRVSVDANAAATYRSGSELISAYSRDQTVIRALAGHDYALRRRVAAAVLTGVRWGAA